MHEGECIKGANKLRSHNLCGWSHTKMGREIDRVAAGNMMEQ